MKKSGKASQYTIEFKKAVIEEYLSSNLSQVEIGRKYNLAIQYVREGKQAGRPMCSIINNWHALYKKDLLKVNNAIAVSHTPKEVIGIVSSMPYEVTEVEPPIVVSNKRTLKRYVAPEIFVLDGVEYVLE